LKGVDLNALKSETERGLPLLDCVDPIVLRNNRWRCDHGWDIDLDDGSSHYELRQNLCLNGGIKLREGFYRLVEGNVMVNNSFHPHVWYRDSGDIFRRNIVFTTYKPIGMEKPWGQECDFNLLHAAGKAQSGAATALHEQSGRDDRSMVGDAEFVDAPHADYRVRETSLALRLGFTNFSMNQFGVTNPRLKSLARTPQLPVSTSTSP
jgi:hypothetical protein